MLQKDILLILFFIHIKKKSLPYLVMIRDCFITSLSWRSLYLDVIDFVKKSSLKIDVLEKMIESEKLMREFLINERHDIGNIEHHIFFFDRVNADSIENDAFKVGRPNTTVHRSLTSYSGYMGDTIYTISNLMGIVIVTFYSKDADEVWDGTQVLNGDNTIAAVNQRIATKVANEFSFWMKQCDEASNSISEEDEQKILKNITKLGNTIKDCEVYQDIVDDFQ